MLDIQSELHETGQPYQEMYEAVVSLKRRHDLHPCAVRVRDGLSFRSEGDRDLVQDLVHQFRRLPEETRRKLPALWNSLAQLEIVVGDIEASLADFQEVASLVQDPISRAEAHHNTYLAALERGQWETALTALRRAVALDAETFEPFPFSRYEPIRILGFGGSGISFLCKDRHRINQQVVVKVLRSDSLDRDPASLFREAQILQELDHPVVARILQTSLGSPEGSAPYLVYEQIEGEPLDRVVARQGPFSPDDWLEIAWPLLRALQQMHQRGILHRGLRPSSILIRQEVREEGSTHWHGKLLDIGLAFRRVVIHACASNPDRALDSALGRTIRKLIPFAAPETLGRIKGNIWLGPHTDLFAFGRLCALALTGKAQPDQNALQLLPEPWQQVIASCTSWNIAKRPAHAQILHDQLLQLPGAEERVHQIDRSLQETMLAGLTARLKIDPEDSETYRRRAAILTHQAKYEEALADYAELIHRHPEDASLYRGRAQVHLRMDQIEEAIEQYTLALQQEPRHHETLFRRGMAHAQKLDYRRAIEDYTEALRLNPRDELLYFNRGNAFFYSGDYARAIADFTEALHLDRNNLWTRSNRGKAYLMQGDATRAIADFTHVLQIDPGDVRALCDRASAHLEQRRHDRAIADYTEAIRLGPGASLLHDRGMVHGICGNWDQAIADFTEALQLAPETASILISRGRIHFAAGHLEEALADFTEALRLAPGSLTARVQRADVLKRLKRIEEALDDLNRALEESPNSLAYFQRGNLLADQGEYDRAIADFTEVIGLDADAGHAYMNRGLARLQLQDIEGAIADFGEAIHLHPGEASALINRGIARRTQGDRDGALTDFTAAIAVEPSQLVSYYNRASLLAELGRLGEAIADLDHVLLHSPDDVGAYLSRGRLLVQLGIYDRAIADNLAAVNLAPDNPRYANNLAWLLATVPDETCRDPQRAIEFARKALTEGEDALRLDTLAAALAAAGQMNEAIKTQRQALELATESEKEDYLSRLTLYENGQPYIQERNSPSC